MRNSLDVISDQLGVPTSPSLISKVTVDAIHAAIKNREWPKGIYHLVPRGVSSWHEIAQTLIDYAGCQNIQPKFSVKVIQAIATADYPTAAKRPLNSQLNTNKISMQLSFDLKIYTGRRE